MREIAIGADELVRALLKPGVAKQVCLLDSCGVGRKGANLLIAGIEPVETIVFPASNASADLAKFERLISNENLAAVFTISYDFGLDLNGIPGRTYAAEPGIYVGLFDHLLIHDYDNGKTFASGNSAGDSTFKALQTRESNDSFLNKAVGISALPSSNFKKDEYISAVEAIKELIRAGDTYQTNLTQQLTVSLDDLTQQSTFLALRRDHRAPFAAYIDRHDSVVVSASPEQFLRIEYAENDRRIIAEPIKGTRRRGKDKTEDDELRSDLLTSEKDIAENTMIVDLMRNDLGRICEFGSVTVEDLCRVEEHPTLFHLVSTVRGMLRNDVGFADIVRATYPCGSITGAPKLRTMEIIDRLENVPRGLSMGAIGCRIPRVLSGREEIFEMSVAIRTMVIRECTATFNVGGGIVIDSEPEKEYAESMLKAKALLQALKSRSGNNSPLSVSK